MSYLNPLSKYASITQTPSSNTTLYVLSSIYFLTVSFYQPKKILSVILPQKIKSTLYLSLQCHIFYHIVFIFKSTFTYFLKHFIIISQFRHIDIIYHFLPKINLLLVYHDCIFIIPITLYIYYTIHFLFLYTIISFHCFL